MAFNFYPRTSTLYWDAHSVHRKVENMCVKAHDKLVRWWAILTVIYTSSGKSGLYQIIKHNA